MFALDLADIDLKDDDLETKLLQTLDKHAPEVTKKITKRKRQPWCDDNIKKPLAEERRCGESISSHTNGEPLKMHSDLQHSTTRQEGRLHQHHHSRKQERQQETIQDIKQHHWKHLRKPLPEAESDEELANNFADFFIQKIQKIRDSLEHHLKYDPSKSTTRQREVIRQFREVSDDEV